MARRKRRWSYQAGTRPHTVTVYERERGGVLQAAAWDPSMRGGQGGQRRMSLGHRDRERAEAYAKRVAEVRATESANETARRLATEEAREFAREEQKRAFERMLSRQYREHFRHEYKRCYELEFAQAFGEAMSRRQLEEPPE